MLVVAIEVQFLDQVLKQCDGTIGVQVGFTGFGLAEAGRGEGVHHPDLGHREARVSSACAVAHHL